MFAGVWYVESQFRGFSLDGLLGYHGFRAETLRSIITLFTHHLILSGLLFNHNLLKYILRIRQPHVHCFRVSSQLLGHIVIEFREDLRGELVLHEASECLSHLQTYLFTGLLQKTVVIGHTLDDEAQETVHIAIVFGVGDALRLESDETLKGMDDFLSELPGVAVCLAQHSIRIENLIDLFVLLHKREDEFVGRLAYFSLFHKSHRYLFVGETGHHILQLEHSLGHHRVILSHQFA